MVKIHDPAQRDTKPDLELTLSPTVDESATVFAVDTLTGSKYPLLSLSDKGATFSHQPASVWDRLPVGQWGGRVKIASLTGRRDSGGGPTPQSILKASPRAIPSPSPRPTQRVENTEVWQREEGEVSVRLYLDRNFLTVAMTKRQARILAMSILCQTDPLYKINLRGD